LALIEDLEALFIHTLLERELVFFFFDFGRSDLGCADVNPLYACAGSKRPVALPRDAQFLGGPRLK
jgi:hypothetical protein